MPFVRADVQRFLDMLAAVDGPQMYEVEPATARQMFRRMVELAERPAPDSVESRDFTLPGPAGVIAARSYHPANAVADGTAILYLHGGGFVLGDLESHHSLVAEISRLTSYPAVAVDYRLAPEAPWPAAVDDALAAARALVKAPEDSGLAVRRLIRAGESAGGTLAARLARALRHELEIAAQWLIYPATETAAKGGSIDAFGEGYMLSGKSLRWFGRHYAPDPYSERSSPLLSDDWEALPPALVFACGLDPIRDQGRDYAAKLAANGNRLIFREGAGQIHGSMQLRGMIPSAQCDLEQQAADLKALLA